MSPPNLIMVQYFTVIFCVLPNHIFSFTTEHSTTWGPLTIPPELNMTAEMTRSRLIPDIIDVAPPWPVRVTYKWDSIHFGNHLNRLQLKVLPSFINWRKYDGRFYTLVMTGPDTPTMESPKNREFQHWLVGNIPARYSGIKEGETLTEYKVELTPLYAEGDHRIAFLMFEQPSEEKLMFDEYRIHRGSNDTLRTNFSTRAFVKKYNLTIIGANYVRLDFMRFDPVPDIDPYPPECAPDKIVRIDE